MNRLTERTTNGACLILNNPHNDEEARKQVMEQFKKVCNKLADFEDEAEKRKKGCEYCKQEKYIREAERSYIYKSGIKGLDMWVDDDSCQIHIEAYTDTYEPSYVEEDIEIKYCPMCGRKLGD